MYFTPKVLFKTPGTSLRFDASTEVILPPEVLPDVLLAGMQTLYSQVGGTLCQKLTFALGIPEDVQNRVKAQGAYAANGEEYVISLGAESHVWAQSYRGLLYGLATLQQLQADGELSELFLYDYPVSPIRGYRVFLPGHDTMDEFYRMIDMLAYYKYNSIILEIGGAMEYKNHPEINGAWIDFCNDVRRYSGRAHEIQFGMYPWAKNSIHCDNGDGGVLTQAECAAIAAYCRDRGIEVIPEEPTLSHTDYMCLAHPDIREQEGDAYPDTYCPSNPASYKLAFELLDEVIEVFQPNYINIGHDETYSIGVCPRCQGKSPVDLYVADVTKVHDYLASRGVKTVMWGEKLLDARFPNGEPCGGAETRVTDAKTGESRVYIPALYPCADKLPRDILMLDWYWIFDEANDHVFHDNGYPMVFGNLSVSKFEHWKKRIGWGAQGGFVSNWGSNAEEYLQRNGQTFQLLFTAYAFWCPDYDDDMREELGMRAAAEYYRRRHAGMQRVITIVHSTDYYLPSEAFYDGIFITEEKYKLGDYELTYTDGTTAKLPVFYGTHILGQSVEPTVKKGEYTETFGSTMPCFVDGKLCSRCGYEDPHPDKAVAGIVYRPLKTDATVEVHSVSVG